MIDNTNSLKTKKIEDDQQYIRGQRYLIEIKDLDTGRVYYSKRIACLPNAERIRDDYDALKSMAARVFDTLTGEILFSGGK